MVLAIVLLFTFSSLAYVAVGIFGGPQQQQFQPLNNFVVEGDVDPYTQSVYIQNYFTFLKYYYNESAPVYIDTLPAILRTNTGEMQLFVVKIPDTQTYASVEKINGRQDIDYPDEEKIMAALCNSLVATPSECSLFFLNMTVSA
jgi:hypothetical protein